MITEQYIMASRPFLKIIFILSIIASCSSKPIGSPLQEESVTLITDSKISSTQIQDNSVPAEDSFSQLKPGAKHRNLDLPNDIIRKKVNIIIVILSFCVVCAIILSFVNVHDDYVEMSNFYRGYMGRRLLIQEKRLVYRGQVERMRHVQTGLEAAKQEYLYGGYPPHNGGVIFIKLEETLSPVTTTSMLTPGPMTTTSLLPPGPKDSWLDITRPGMPVVRRFIEDEEPEWRELDYQIRVGKPPASYCSFLRQYDWNMFTADGLSKEEIEEQKNLLNEFRKWKKRKRKTFNIVVTERARREMADQEEEKNKKRTPPSK